MLLNATAGTPGDIGTLVSHQIENTGPLCAISFWYNMKGSGVGKLQVSYRGNQAGKFKIRSYSLL